MSESQVGMKVRGLGWFGTPQGPRSVRVQGTLVQGEADEYGNDLWVEVPAGDRWIGPVSGLGEQGPFVGWDVERKLELELDRAE